MLGFDCLLFFSEVNFYRRFCDVLTDVAKLFKQLNFCSCGDLALEILEGSSLMRLNQG